jgi:hypothetical protein
MTRLLIRLGEVSGRRPWLDAVPPAEREPVLGEGGGLPQSVEGEDGAAVVGEVDVELRGRVVVRHHRQDRGPWPRQGSAAPTAGPLCTRRCPRRGAALRTCSDMIPIMLTYDGNQSSISQCPSLRPTMEQQRWYSLCRNPESRLCAMFVTPARLVHHQRIFCAWTVS